MILYIMYAEREINESFHFTQTFFQEGEVLPAPENLLFNHICLCI